MDTKAKLYDADGIWTGEYVIRTPEQQAEHERKVAAYRAEVAARPARRKNSSVYINHDNEE